MTWTRVPIARNRFDVDRSGSRVDYRLRILVGLHIVEFFSMVEIVQLHCTISTCATYAPSGRSGT